MEAKKYLANYGQKIEKFLEQFFSGKKKEAAKIYPQIVKMIQKYQDYLEGGKKLRGVLTVLGYQLAGGKDIKAIIPVSAAMEIFHSFLLIHDDWIDQDKMRRGKLTIHEQYAQEYDKDTGAGLAIVLGDTGAFWGYGLVVSSQFPEKDKIEALRKINNFLENTAFGQVLDITFDFLPRVTSEDIFLVHTYKTAYYSLVMPLTVGAILAGANEILLKQLNDFGIALGIAFQLQDDNLGVFGKKEKTGKLAESDIRQGKKTLLLVKTIELARPSARKYFLKYYGKKDLTQDQMIKVREIIRVSGALPYSQKTCQELIAGGKKFIPEITSDSRFRKILEGLTDFLIEREN